MPTTHPYERPFSLAILLCIFLITTLTSCQPAEEPRAFSEAELRMPENALAVLEVADGLEA